MSRNTESLTFPGVIGKAGLFSDGDWVESKDQDPRGDVRLIQLADVGVGEWINKSARFMTSQKAAELNCTFLEPGDILIARMPDPIGRACIFPGDPKRCVTVVDVCILRADPETADQRYLMHMINSLGFQHKISRWVTGTTRQRISRGNLGKLNFQLPPLAEQKRIAAILDKADAIRRKRQQAIQLTSQFLRSTFLDMFGDPVTNPKGWAAGKLGDFADIRSGVTKGRKLGGMATVSVPYMRVANVQDGRIDLNEIKNIEVLPSDVDKFRLHNGDVLLTEGGDFDKLGRGAVWREEVKGCIHQNHIFCVRTASDAFSPDYLSMLIGSARGKRYFLRAAKQTTGIATINKSQLKDFPTLHPPLELQDRFSRVSARFREMHQRLQGRLLTADNLFNSLVQRAFRGEL